MHQRNQLQFENLYMNTKLNILILYMFENNYNNTLQWQCISVGKSSNIFQTSLSGDIVILPNLNA